MTISMVDVRVAKQATEKLCNTIQTVKRATALRKLGGNRGGRCEWKNENKDIGFFEDSRTCETHIAFMTMVVQISSRYYGFH